MEHTTVTLLIHMFSHTAPMPSPTSLFYTKNCSEKSWLHQWLRTFLERLKKKILRNCMGPIFGFTIIELQKRNPKPAILVQAKVNYYDSASKVHRYFRPWYRNEASEVDLSCAVLIKLESTCKPPQFTESHFCTQRFYGLIT